MVWKAGKPNVSIRKAAIVCLIKLIEKKLIEKERLYEAYISLLAVMKNCLDEDWVNDLRYASVVALKHIMSYIGEDFKDDDHKEMYTELLKRLDDSQDAIRIETCKVFEIFFETLPDPWSSSLFEYTIKSIFVHVDDPNEAIQQAVTKVLHKACRVQTQQFIQLAGDISNKSAHPALCKAI